MGNPTDIDLGGNTLIVRNIKTGYATPGSSSAVPQSTAAGSTLTASNTTHAGRIINLDTASGSTITLPASTGSGDQYRFVVTTTVTSNNHIIKVANASDTMAGYATVRSATPGIFEAATTGDTITMNGTTTGGVIGSSIQVIDTAPTVWEVRANLVGSGTVATPFSATV